MVKACKVEKILQQISGKVGINFPLEIAELDVQDTRAAGRVGSQYVCTTFSCL